MEIIGVETYTLHRPLDKVVGDSRLAITDVYWIVVEIETDSGITGTGWMGSLGFAPELLERFVTQYEGALLGKDPFCTNAIRETLRRHSIYFGEVGMSAWPRGAIDVALWDIKAQACGQPLYKLLGGSDNQVPAYASSMDINVAQENLGVLHGKYADEGFTVFKTKVGDKSPSQEAARIAEIRQMVGPEADILVDANQAWTVAEAIRTVEGMTNQDIAWVEEPISEFNIEGHRRVAEEITPPLATGEMLYRPQQFNHLMKRQGVGVVQPDLIRGGGVTGATAVSQLAAANDVPLATHFYYAISAHIVSAAPTGWTVEYIPEYDIAPLLESPPTIKDGTVKIPDDPGHGYRIDPAAKEEFLVKFD